MRECKVSEIPTREKAEQIKGQFESDGCQDAEITRQDNGTFTVTAQCEDN